MISTEQVCRTIAPNSLHLGLNLLNRCSFGVRCHHCRGFFKCTLKLLVCFLLYSLRVLQLLDQLHLELLHLHDLFFLLRSHVVLVYHTIVMMSLHLLDTSRPILFDLHSGQAFLLVNNLILHAVLLLDLKVLELLFLFVLLLDYF